MALSATTAFAIPPTFFGPYQIELEDGLTLHMTDDFSAEWESDSYKPSGLYRNEELVYAIGSFIPQEYLMHVSANGMHMIWLPFGETIETIGCLAMNWKWMALLVK